MSWDVQARTKGKVRGQGCLGRNKCVCEGKGGWGVGKGKFKCKQVSSSILIWL